VFLDVVHVLLLLSLLLMMMMIRFCFWVFPFFPVSFPCSELEPTRFTSTSNREQPQQHDRDSNNDDDDVDETTVTMTTTMMTTKIIIVNSDHNRCQHITLLHHLETQPHP
jgi:hypothetical protein